MNGLGRALSASRRREADTASIEEVLVHSVHIAGRRRRGQSFNARQEQETGTLAGGGEGPICPGIAVLRSARCEDRVSTQSGNSEHCDQRLFLRLGSRFKEFQYTEFTLKNLWRPQLLRNQRLTCWQTEKLMGFASIKW